MFPYGQALETLMHFMSGTRPDFAEQFLEDLKTQLHMM